MEKNAKSFSRGFTTQSSIQQPDLTGARCAVSQNTHTHRNMYSIVAMVPDGTLAVWGKLTLTGKTIQAKYALCSLPFREEAGGWSAMYCQLDCPQENDDILFFLKNHRQFQILFSYLG